MADSDEPASSAEISSRRFWLLVGGAALVMILGCWLASGTLAPYGTKPFGDCRYRINGDHLHFKAVFHMLDGRPYDEWSYSVVLRRILHPLLAYPWMKVFGFDLGGLLFNIFLHVVTLVGFALALRRFFDARAAVLATWLLASYPGYAYWVGLPYSYAFIVPGSIACTIALLWLNDRPSLVRTAVAACVVGIVGLGYDLIPFFGGGLLLVLIGHRRWRDVALAVVILAAWVVFIGRGLPAIFGFPAMNSNTQTYAAVVDSYFDAWNRTQGWGSLLLSVPYIFISNFVFSNFVFFPILFVWLVAIRRYWRIEPMFGRVALSILLSTLLVFLFLNLAPPYEGWQLRGTWIPRLFQPWFVVVLVMVAATAVALRGTRRYKLFVWSVIAIAVLDGAVIAGPFIGLTTLYARVNTRFYNVPGHDLNALWLRRLGRRPYGICR